MHNMTQQAGGSSTTDLHASDQEEEELGGRLTEGTVAVSGRD